MIKEYSSRLKRRVDTIGATSGAETAYTWVHPLF